jgi:hypothetical protein
VAAGVVGLFDAVAVVASAFDHARVAAVAAGVVQVAAGGDVLADGGKQPAQAVRGKRSPGRRRGGARCAGCVGT